MKSQDDLGPDQVKPFKDMVRTENHSKCVASHQRILSKGVMW